MTPFGWKINVILVVIWIFQKIKVLKLMKIMNKVVKELIRLIVILVMTLNGKETNPKLKIWKINNNLCKIKINK